MNGNWTDICWAWTQRFLSFAGAFWMISILIGPSFENSWILLAAAVASIASLSVVTAGGAERLDSRSSHRN